MAGKEKGVMGSNPITGECFAAYKSPVLQNEFSELMKCGALLESKPLQEVKDNFCEVHPSRRVVSFGPVLGRYSDQAIHEWFETADGQRHIYVGICGPQPDLDLLRAGQSVLAPGLIYQISS